MKKLLVVLVFLVVVVGIAYLAKDGVPVAKETPIPKIAVEKHTLPTASTCFWSKITGCRRSR